MTELRKRMLEELQRRNYAQTTIETYLGAVEDFARYFGKRPDRLSQEDLRKYPLHLIRHRKLAVRTVVVRIGPALFLCEDAPPSVSAHRPALLETSCTAADGIEFKVRKKVTRKGKKQTEWVAMRGASTMPIPRRVRNRS